MTSQSHRRVVLKDDPYIDWGESELQFRLTYQGLLLSEAQKGGLLNARASHKQSIRKHFHKQLKRLWEIAPNLKKHHLVKDPVAYPEDTAKGVIFGYPKFENTVEGLSRRFSCGAYKLVPLLTEDLGIHCSIDVLYLRNDPPGSILVAGDIDNRLKTLFDALKMPHDAKQLGEFTEPEEDEKPFYCLLQDDSLITKAAVETDTLLSPVSTSPDVNDARVIITVKTLPYQLRSDTIGFA